MQPHWQFNLDLVKLISDVWPPEFKDNKFMLFYTTKFVTIALETNTEGSYETAL